MHGLGLVGLIPVLALTLLNFIAGSVTEVSAQAVGAGEVLINEFRLAGPTGNFDEYLEFYCNRDSDCDIGTYFIIAFDPSIGDFITPLPEGLIIPARGYLLIGDDFGYSLNTYATIDLPFSFAGSTDFFIDNQGFQLISPDFTTVIDSVGFVGESGEIIYSEGTGLQPATAERPADQYAYVRKIPRGNRRPQDTNDNSNDFVLVSVTGAAHPGITTPPVLGAPGPQNLSSAVETSSITPALIEPALPSSVAPNRVRVGSGNSGTVSIRRSFTNNTGADVTSLVFRVVQVTTLNSPGYKPGGTQADIRLVTSGDAETFVNSEGRTVSIHGTALQFDDGSSEPNQPNGGGLNSSVVGVLPGILGSGDTTDVQFLLNVVQAGSFRFFVNIEASTGTPAVPSRPRKGSSIVR